MQQGLHSSDSHLCSLHLSDRALSWLLCILLCKLQGVQHRSTDAEGYHHSLKNLMQPLKPGVPPCSASCTMNCMASCRTCSGA